MDPATTTTDIRDSPYITNFDLVPPSPSHHSNLDYDHHHHHHFSPLFGAAFDDHQNNTNNNNSNSNINNNNNICTASSSYNGSYFNSPYSQHSDLPELDFLQDFPTTTTTTDAGMNDYEPSDYDAPAAATPNSLLMFTGDPFMSAIDPHRPRGSPLLYDQGSPASSTGIDETGGGGGGGRHSRASSVASNNHPSPSAAAQPAFHHPSPRLDVVHSFGNMSVHTPGWSAQPLPSPRIAAAVELLSPQQKPQSPPRLTMPSDGLMSFDSEPTAVPMINAPEGENAAGAGGDAEGGPSFNIVPATPVTGADGTTGRQHIPFQSNLATLTQDVELITDNPIGDPLQQQSPQQQQHQRASPYASPLLLPSDILPTTQSLFPLEHQQHQQQQQDQDIRQRRNSDSSTTWAGQNQQHLGSLSADSSFTFQIDEQHRQQLQSFTFGGGSSSTINYLTTGGGGGGGGGDGIRRTVSDSLAAPRMHRQSRSEEIRPLVTFGHTPGLGGGGFHGQSNSIGTTTEQGSSYLFPPSSHSEFIQRQQQQQQQQQTQFLHPNDLRTPGVVGLSSPEQQQQQLQQLSSGTERRSLSPGMGGQHHHYRRASSGSRSERGAEVWGTQADPLLAHHHQLQLHPHHHHHHQAATTNMTRRMSPYPTPSTSPRGNFTQELEELNDLSLTGGGGAGGGGGGGGGLGLGLITVGVGGEPLIPGIGDAPVSAGYTEEVSIAGRGVYGGGGMMMGDGAASHGGGHHQRAESVHSMGGDEAAGGGGGGQGVMKQSVTTGRTANASIRRRKQEATFVCKVPGCGSTFTRGFNLKGHMRSHYEQKPYKCHWPGCDKGFARQHDCKRHEQLHSNYRPFACGGCGKNFARMDALNRHLRSEAGVECAARAVATKERGQGQGQGQGLERREDLGGGGGDDDDDMMMMMQEDDEKKSSLPRRRNMGLGNQLQLQDELWSVAL